MNPTRIRDRLRRIRLGTLLGSVLWMTACGGGGGGAGGGGAGSGASNPAPPAATYVIGGSVAGLVGSVVIQNNAADDRRLSANGAFSFATPITHGGAYAVTVLTQPAGQTCSVANASGTANAAVTQVSISCATSFSSSALALFAGNMQDRGHVDGTGAAAHFSLPSGITSDSAGKLVVADWSNHTIRKITPAGAVATLAGLATAPTGSADGVGAAARFNFPQGVATDSGGNVYVADTSNHTIRKITPAGAVSTLAGSAGLAGSADGNGAAARFKDPTDLATDSAGNVYVADFSNRTIRKITPAGAVSTLAGAAGLAGSTDGSGAAARFGGATGIATDSVGNIYVADKANQTIRRITPAGAVSTLAGAAGVFGSVDGAGAAARFFGPHDVATDSLGNVYVADNLNHTIRKITPAGAVSTIVGVPGHAGFAPGPLPGALAAPAGVAVSGDSLYVTMAHGVAVVTPLP